MHKEEECPCTKSYYERLSDCAAYFTQHSAARAIRLFLCFFLLAMAAPAVAEPPQLTALVTAIAGGDTITVLTQDKQQIEIRLYGIDCPENGQPFGSHAKQTMSDAVFGKEVVVQPIDTDQDGRMVAIVYLLGGDLIGDNSLNAALAGDGLAWVDPKLCTRQDICWTLKKLTQIARSQHKGLWADNSPIAPWEWRKRQNNELALKSEKEKK